MGRSSFQITSQIHSLPFLSSPVHSSLPPPLFSPLLSSLFFLLSPHTSRFSPCLSHYLFPGLFLSHLLCLLAPFIFSSPCFPSVPFPVFRFFLPLSPLFFPSLHLSSLLFSPSFPLTPLLSPLSLQSSFLHLYSLAPFLLSLMYPEFVQAINSACDLDWTGVTSEFHTHRVEIWAYHLWAYICFDLENPS